jgi:hypothetical protein
MRTKGLKEIRSENTNRPHALQSIIHFSLFFSFTLGLCKPAAAVRGFLTPEAPTEA